MDMKKQTAVEWLMEQLNPTISVRLSDTYIKELSDQAKAMMNEQIEEAYRAGYTDCSLGRFSDCEQYYTSTFEQ
jgi:hypothetical protein